LIIREARDRAIVQRLRAVREGPQPQRRKLPRGQLAFKLVHRLGELIRERFMSKKDVESLQHILAASGLDPARGLPVFLGAKVLCLAAIPALVFIYGFSANWATPKLALYTGLSFPVGMMLPNWIIGFVRRRYQKELRRGIPDALDLMVVCAQAGLGLETAIERVSSEMKHTNRPAGLEFSLLGHEMRILPDRRTALLNFGERTGQESLRRLGGTLAQTLKYGTPLSQSLRVLAAEMRQERLIQFEERAARLPALLVLPMVLFILPCLFIVLVGPSVVQLLASLHG
jgi:tight adherence protein C